MALQEAKGMAEVTQLMPAPGWQAVYADDGLVFRPLVGWALIQFEEDDGDTLFLGDMAETRSDVIGLVNQDYGPTPAHLSSNFVGYLGPDEDAPKWMFETARNMSEEAASERVSQGEG
jgi:hypothetical protein